MTGCIDIMEQRQASESRLDKTIKAIVLESKGVRKRDGRQRKDHCKITTRAQERVKGPIERWSMTLGRLCFDPGPSLSGQFLLNH